MEFPMWAKHLIDLFEYGLFPMWAKRHVGDLYFTNMLSWLELNLKTFWNLQKSRKFKRISKMYLTFLLFKIEPACRLLSFNFLNGVLIFNVQCIYLVLNIFTEVNLKWRPTILTMPHATLAHALRVSYCCSHMHVIIDSI